MKSVTIVSTVQFKGLSVPPALLRPASPVCNPKHQAIPGKHWHKATVDLDTSNSNAVYRFVPWAHTHCSGAFACALDSVYPKATFVMYFEQLNDALKFKLTNAQEVITDAS